VVAKKLTCAILPVVRAAKIIEYGLTCLLRIVVHAEDSSLRLPRQISSDRAK